MGDGKKLCMSIEPRFYEVLERIAKEQNLTVTNLIRRAVSRDAISFVDNHPPGFYTSDDRNALESWEKFKGGDYSEIRAAKDKNYKKKTLAEKIDEAKELLNKLEKGKRENE